MENIKAPVTVDELDQLFLFKGESPDILEWLLETCPIQTYPPGHVLLEAGQVNDVLYIILEGRVRVKLEDVDDKTIGVLDSGQSVGEMSVIDNSTTSADVIIDTPTRLMAISRETLWSLINRSHIIARNLLFILSSRVRKSNEAITKMMNQQRLIEHISQMDALTGLHNRRWLETNMDSLIKRYQQNQKPFSVVLLDVDHFKRYNDTHGHLAGDQALKAVGRAVLKNIRPNDLAARFGGEEFIVFLPDAPLKTAREVAERLRIGVYEESITNGDRDDLPPVSISAGITELKVSHTPKELLEAADVALYQAKQQGRNRVVVG